MRAINREAAILNSKAYKNGEPFSLSEAAKTMRTKQTTAQGVLSKLVSEDYLVMIGANSFRRRAMSVDWLRRAWR